MTRLLQALLLSCSLCTYTFASEQKAATQLRISYLNHPSVLSFALPIVKSAYLRAGIDAEFIELPAHRLLQEIDAGHTDGDVIHAQEIFTPFSNIMKVGPPLTRVEYLLLCAPDVPCDNSVLISSPETIVATDQSKRVITSQYPSARNRNFYPLNFLGKLPELLNTHRFNYAIYIVSSEWPLPESLQHLQMHPLFSSEAYHILHKRFAKLAPVIGKAIEEELEKRNSQANQITKE
ncbi:hypothetical protein [Pseudoalteromonas xiamenensis]